jgi:hypothetical protein
LLNTGTILLPEIPTSEAADQDPSTSDFLEKYFLPSFILADKLCIHDLMNRLIDLLAGLPLQAAHILRSHNYAAGV